MHYLARIDSSTEAPDAPHLQVLIYAGNVAHGRAFAGSLRMRRSEAYGFTTLVNGITAAAPQLVEAHAAGGLDLERFSGLATALEVITGTLPDFGSLPTASQLGQTKANEHD